MSIDGFTFAAQIVNFLILVALLRWLLYGPIVRAMDAREEKIAKRLEEAEREQETAERKAGEYEEKNRQLDRQREKLLDEARQEAGEEKKRMSSQAREELDRKREQWQEAFLREQEELLYDLQQKAGEMAVDAARRVLSHLAGEELEVRMCEAFAAQVRQLDEKQRSEIRNHFGDGEMDLSILSAFKLAEPQREQLRSAVHDAFDTRAEISFERSDELVCGLQLDVGGYTFGWNITNFLRDIDLAFAEKLRSSK